MSDLYCLNLACFWYFMQKHTNEELVSIRCTTVNQSLSPRYLHNSQVSPSKPFLDFPSSIPVAIQQQKIKLSSNSKLQEFYLKKYNTPL